MATELVLDQLQDLGFIVKSDPEDYDGSEVIYQEGLFQFILGERRIREEGLTARDVIRLLVTSLTSRESQEEELSRMFGTTVKMVMEGDAPWTPVKPVPRTDPWPKAKRKKYRFKKAEK